MKYFAFKLTFNNSNKSLFNFRCNGEIIITRITLSSETINPKILQNLETIKNWMEGASAGDSFTIYSQDPQKTKVLLHLVALSNKEDEF